ncbi:hypothetical protein P4O66_004546 [Electrophorus voltai]|uniref:Uncharacterized protein n=1 Tax=Electrophorus voltai TaxID=2609070 RepID=A0AAD9DZP4_9TELE|nr:hypothetical protein P4O66_004546 [Electrophorus voltai]
MKRPPETEKSERTERRRPRTKGGHRRRLLFSLSYLSVDRLVPLPVQEFTLTGMSVQQPSGRDGSPSSLRLSVTKPEIANPLVLRVHGHTGISSFSKKADPMYFDNTKIYPS